MKTTININVAGYAFIIEEEAYQNLHTYLQRIKNKIEDENEANDIINDIEARLAELFRAELKISGKEVIDSANVEKQIAILGNPDEIFGEENAEEKSTDKAGKRVFRDPDNKLFGGVLSGLSAYLGIEDPIWLRIIFILLIVAGIGSPILIYIIAMIIIPEAKTKSEKLQMRGEKINLNSLTNTINDPKLKSQAQKGISSIGNALETALRWLVKSLPYVIGFIVISSAISWLIAVAVFAVSGSILSISEYVGLVFDTKWQALLLVALTTLVLAIPAVWATYVCIRLLMSKKHQWGVSIGLLGLWLISLIFAGIITTRIISDYMVVSDYKQITAIENPSDTLYLFAKNDMLNAEDIHLPYGMKSLEVNGIKINDNQCFIEDINLDIEPTDEAEAYYEVRFKSRGRTNQLAKEKAERVEYRVSQQAGKLIFDSFFSFPMKDKVGSSDVAITLKVPKGKSVYLDKSMINILDDMPNTHRFSRKDMLQHYWTANDLGFSSSDIELNEILSDSTDLEEVSEYVKVEIPENVQINASKDSLVIKVK